ncbi:MAG: hypothetical protein IJX81_04685 [Clostridia bacterium]|nr:hypothetical protein [Clostridia bacterium]
MDLYRLFSTCLYIPYEKVGVSANYKTVKKEGVLYLFFEDSDGKTDWKNNLDFPAKAYKRMGKTVWFAHRGFLKVWKELEPFIAPAVLDKSVSRVVIAGYSHGAALALLCHEYVWYHRPDLKNALEGYGFGCPRVLWGILSPAVRKRWEKFTVIRNLDDFVTHLPPAFLGYSHVGSLLKIGKKGKYAPIEAHYPQNISKELKEYQNKE